MSEEVPDAVTVDADAVDAVLTASRALIAVATNARYRALVVLAAAAAARGRHGSLRPRAVTARLSRTGPS
jgi:hypothetical protein